MGYTEAPWISLYMEHEGEIVYRVHPVMRALDCRIKNEDDARLMARAPDLLEALEVCAEQLANCLGEHNKAVEQARKVIKAAKGKAARE